MLPVPKMTFATLRLVNVIATIKFLEKNVTSVSQIFGDFPHAKLAIAMASLIVVIKLLVYALIAEITHKDLIVKSNFLNIVKLLTTDV
jgi:hypothetical protein